MIARNKAAVVSNYSYKDKRHLIHSQDSDDHADNNGNGIISSRTNGSHEHAKNGYSGDSDSLTIAHSRSKSAPAINQAGIRLRQRKGEKGKNHEDEDYGFLYLELADLSVKGEGVKEHRADESDVRRLAA